MFGGKGGVGKTTCAAATAVHCARRGERTLVVSTDPTPSLADIFEVHGRETQPAPVLENLNLLELGSEEIEAMWDRRFGSEVYEVFSALVDIEYPDFVSFISSVLPGLAEEFMVDHIRELSLDGRYQRIIWDTAPMGQTLNLLRTPALLRRHLKPAPRIYSRLRLGAQSRRSILDTIAQWEELSGQDLAFLRGEVAVVLVLIPEALAVQQLERILAQLRAHHLHVDDLILNHLVRDPDSDFLRTRAAQQRTYLELLREQHGEKRITPLPAFPREVKGIGRLEEVRAHLFPSPPPP
jgi:arsenite-transporting ATPase